jgi:hypothetical protein
MLSLAVRSPSLIWCFSAPCPRESPVIRLEPNICPSIEKALKCSWGAVLCGPEKCGRAILNIAMIEVIVELMVY